MLGESCHVALAVENSSNEAVGFDADSLRERARSLGHLWVDVGVVPSWAVGTLGDYIASRIEDRLCAQDAMPRSGSVSPELADVVGDQLYRARLIGCEGLSIAIGSLDAITKDGRLRSDDSCALRDWLGAANEGLVRIALPESARSLQGYVAPAPLTDWFAESPPLPKLDVEEASIVRKKAGPAEPPISFHPRREPAARVVPEPDSRQVPLFVESDGGFPSSTVSAEATLAQRISEWCRALDGARGATSFATLEELFVGAYSPLENALCQDTGHVGQREVMERWKRGFEQCYTAAFEHLRTSRQRPPMAFDVPKIAFQLSREHDAPSFELVLVDGFRFDVGQRVHDKLRLQLGGHAECVGRGVLWAPLPSNTAAGLELLARGADGLRHLEAELDEARVVSIKDARRLRKLRAGPHSLFKLDAIVASLEPGKPLGGQGLDRLAAEVSVSSARFIKQQAPGTIVLLFGDHGFRLDDGGHGGASPSEVLVGYQAWRALEHKGMVAAE